MIAESSIDRFWLVALLSTAVACGDDQAGETNAEGSTGGEATETSATTEAADSTGAGVDGREYYDGELSASLGAGGNQARCSTCHSDDGTLEGFSGESMMNIAFKDSWKGGDAPDLLAAINACVTGWMAGPALTESDPELIALVAFLESLSDPTATAPNPLEPEVLVDRAAYEAAYSGGDATAGAAKYTQFCGVCHDVALQVGTFPAYTKTAIGSGMIGYIAQKVRTSGPPPSSTSDAMDITPGPMPFFEPQELPPADLADIIAHLQSG